VIFSLYVMSFAAALVTAVVFKGRFRSDEPFVLELPPYRLPTARQIALRAWQEVRQFLRRATKFIVGGVILIWLLTNLPAGAVPGGADTFAGMLGALVQPVLSPLGIDAKLTVALIFGFFQHFFSPAFGNTALWVEMGQINATFKDPNAFGATLAMLIPLFLGAGVDALLPFEAQANMAVAQVRRDFPTLGIIGGLDKRALAGTRDDIRR
jgi:hypothetical protein